MPLKILPSSAYHGWLGRPSEMGATPANFRAKIAVDDEPLPCYVKVYPLETCEMVNEAIGYTLAEGFGLPIPARAGFIGLLSGQLPPDSRPPGQDAVLAWFTQDMEYPSIKAFGRLATATKAQWEDARAWLRECPDTPAVVEFDELTCNVDRNLGNLLMAGSHAMLIDHGRLFGGPAWTISDLSRRVRERNPSNVLHQVLGDWMHLLNVKSARLAAVEGFRKSWTAGAQGAILAAASEFFTAPDAAIVTDYLEQRLDIVRAKQAIGLLA